MAEGSSKKSLIGFGIFFVVGAIVTAVARLAGLRPPSSNSNSSVIQGAEQGAEIGFWIGSAIGIVVGIVMIVYGLRTGGDQKSNDDS